MIDTRPIKQTRRAADELRRGSRPDVARELSIAITHLEDAEMRLARAAVRASRYPADGENAIDATEEAIVETTIDPEAQADETAKAPIS
jgi:hypothetical protein